ncbi:unnamed protein product, partial [Candidula unifasciata]
YILASDCGCHDVWVEIDKLKGYIRRGLKQNADNKDYNTFFFISIEKCRVSFSARFAKRNGYAIRDEEIGGAYDSSTGVFSAPCDGQYFVTASLRSHQAMDSGYVEGVIAVDKEPKARTSVFIDAPVDNIQSATNGVVLTLRSGQKVAVVVKTTSSGEIIGEDYSVFSGFFLFP